MTPPDPPEHLSEPALAELVELLRGGAVVAVPTDTVYGLAVDPWVPGAASRLFAVKGRPETLALPVLVPDVAAAQALAGGLEAPAARLADRYWPGALTLVVPRAADARALELGGDPSTIGLRCPASAAARSLLRRAGALAVTSANPHGAPPLVTAEEVRATFGDRVAAVLDGGRCDGTPSTVVRLVGGGFEVLRGGSLDPAELEACAAGPRT